MNAKLLKGSQWKDVLYNFIVVTGIKSEWVAPGPHPERQEVGADVTDPDRLGQAVLHDRHLLGRALGAQQATTVAAVVAPSGQTELGLEIRIMDYYFNFTDM